MPDNPLPDLDLGLTNNRFVKWLATTGAWRLGKNDDELIFDRMSFQLDAGAAEIGLFSYGEGGPEYIPGVNSTPPKTGEWKPGCRLALHSADVPNGLGEPPWVDDLDNHPSGGPASPAEAVPAVPGGPGSQGRPSAGRCGR